MVTNAEVEELPPTRSERTATAVRVAVGGHPQASVRRIFLWGLVFIGLGLALAVAPSWIGVLTVTVAAVLLALTDQLV